MIDKSDPQPGHDCGQVARRRALSKSRMSSAIASVASCWAPHTARSTAIAPEVYEAPIWTQQRKARRSAHAVSCQAGECTPRRCSFQVTASVEASGGEGKRVIKKMSKPLYTGTPRRRTRAAAWWCGRAGPRQRSSRRATDTSCRHAGSGLKPGIEHITG